MSSSSSDSNIDFVLPADEAAKDRTKEVEVVAPVENFPSLVSGFIGKEDFSSVFIASSDFNYHSYTPQTQGWGAGYHCFQTLYSNLLKIPHLKEHLGKVWVDSVPSVFAIQLKLEEAWKNGFDPDGAAYFKGQLYNTKKFLGATDIWTLLRFLRISTKIIDFPADPRKAVDWIVQYYTKQFERVMKAVASSSTDKDSIKAATSSELVLDLKDGNPLTFIAPVYLQGDGKCSIAFAVEGKLNQRNVLLLDAALQAKVPQLTSAAAIVPPLRANRFNIEAFAGKQCQVLYVDTLEIVPVGDKVQFPFSDLII